MNDHLHIKIATANSKAGLAVIAVIALVLAWQSVPTQFGNLLAGTTSVVSPNAGDIARAAAALASDDPQVQNLFALTRDDPNEAVEAAEKAVIQGPHDPRWRLSLGRAYEQAGDIDKAEGQFRKAAGLAPNHAFPRWHLGNFYLRQGREEDAIEQLQAATADHARFREQVFSLAWDYFNGDPAQLQRVAASGPEPKAYLARFLAQRGQGAAALAVWDQLGPEEKQRFQGVAWWMMQELYGKGSYPEALEVARQTGQTIAVPESVSNPSFEDPVGDGPQALFGWQLLAGDKGAVFDLDSQVKRSGRRSMRMTFRGALKTDLANLYQTIVVKPDQAYSLDFYLRTEGLRSTTRPVLQVLSANDNQVLASSEMFPPDSTEWVKMSVRFRTTGNTNAISIRTFRPFCGEQCTLAGVVWYDDHELIKE